MRLMRANMLTLVDFADATFRAGRTEIERPRAVGSTEIRCEWLQWVQAVRKLERPAAVYKFQSIFGRFPPLQARRSEKVRSRCADFRQFPSFHTAWVDSGERRGTRSVFAGRYSPAVGERVCAVFGGAGTDDRIYSRSRSAATSGTSAGGIG
jgi:hypothetical protein